MTRRGLVALAALSFGAISADALPIPAVRIPELAGKADLIVLGEAAAGRDIDAATVTLSDGRQVLGQLMSAEIRVLDVIKGTPDASGVTVGYVLTAEPSGYQGPQQGLTEVFFLSQDRDGYRFTSPYYPSKPGAPVTPASGLGPLDTVAAYISAAAESPDLPKWWRVYAVASLAGIPTESTTKELRLLAALSDPDLQLTAISCLLFRNDLTGLPLAVSALLQAGGTYWPDVISNLEGALSYSVRDPQAVPALTRLLREGTTSVRRAAASGLMFMASPAGIDALVQALDDPDFQVREHAVTGLADATGQSAWRPHTADYQEVEWRYLSFWKDWARQRAAQGK